jgi:heptosyltransferase-3
LSGAGKRIGRFSEDGKLWRNRLFTHLVLPENELHQYCAEHNLNILMPLDLTINTRRPFLNVPPEKKGRARAILCSHRISIDEPVIAFHPFSLWKYKELAVDQCASLIDSIRNTYHLPVIITGSADERIRGQEVLSRCNAKACNLAGKTSIGELAAVLSSCRLFIGVDTAALHIAAAVGTPTVGIFGPTSSVNWAPRGQSHWVVAKDMPCAPCRQKGCHGSGKSRCIEELTTGEIMEKVDEAMK